MTFFGSNVTIDGTVSGTEPVVVEGTVRGKINLSSDLRIGTAARVEATVHAKNVTVEGKVTGDPARLAEERTKVRDILRSMPPFPALEGPISFGKNGDALKPVYIIEMQDGKWNLIGTHAAGS